MSVATLNNSRSGSTVDVAYDDSNIILGDNTGAGANATADNTHYGDGDGNGNDGNGTENGGGADADGNAVTPPSPLQRALNWIRDRFVGSPP